MKIVSEVSRSIVVGILGTVLNLSLLYLAKEYLAFHYLIGALIANVITLVFIFVCDKYYTFKYSHGTFHVQFIKYVLVYIASNAGSIALLAFFVELFSVNYLLAQAIATTLVSFLSFLAFKFWIFHCHDWR